MLYDIFVDRPNYERAYATEMVKKTLQEAHAVRDHLPNVVELTMWYTNDRGMLGNRKSDPRVRCTYTPFDEAGIPLSEHIVGQYYGTYEYKFTPKFQNSMRRTFKISTLEKASQLDPGTEGPDGRRYIYLPQMDLNPEAYVFIPYVHTEHAMIQIALCMGRYDKVYRALQSIYEGRGEAFRFATFAFMYSKK